MCAYGLTSRHVGEAPSLPRVGGMEPGARDDTSGVGCRLNRQYPP